MRRPILAFALAAGLIAPAAAAPRQPLTDYDVSRIQGLPDQLAVCDLTAFLATEPDVNADVIYVADPLDHQRWPLRWPYFRPLNVMVDEDLRMAFRELEARGALKRSDVVQARTRYDVGMVESYRRATLPERAFLQDQRRVCNAIVEAALAR
jgi:hypothetical protein